MFVRLATALEMTETLGLETWRDNAGRVADRATLEATLAARLTAMAVDDIVARLQRHRVLVARVRRPDEAAAEAQAMAIGAVVDDGGMLVARSPLAVNGTRTLPRTAAR